MSAINQVAFSEIGVIISFDQFNIDTCDAPVFIDACITKDKYGQDVEGLSLLTYIHGKRVEQVIRGVSRHAVCSDNAATHGERTYSNAALDFIKRSDDKLSQEIWDRVCCLSKALGL